MNRHISDDIETLCLSEVFRYVTAVKIFWYFTAVKVSTLHWKVRHYKSKFRHIVTAVVFISIYNQDLPMWSTSCVYSGRLYLGVYSVEMKMKNKQRGQNNINYFDHNIVNWVITCVSVLQVIFRYALALFKYKEDNILRIHDSVEIYQYLRFFTKTISDSR